MPPKKRESEEGRGGEKEKDTKMQKQGRGRAGHCETDQLRAGWKAGPQTTAVLQAMTTKLAEARGRELNAATALLKLRLTLEHTLNREQKLMLSARRLQTRSRWVRRICRGAVRAAEGGDEGWCTGLAFSW